MPEQEWLTRRKLNNDPKRIDHSILIKAKIQYQFGKKSQFMSMNSLKKTANKFYNLGIITYFKFKTPYFDFHVEIITVFS